MSDAVPGAPRYIRGVPHPLPAGEELLWEGAPGARAIATHVFHWRLLAAYFAVMLLVWATGTTLAWGTAEFVAGLLVRVAASLVAVAIVAVLARVIARTTWYAITNQRLVLRIGMVLPMSINLPFALIESAGVGTFGDGTGQVALRLVPGQRLAYIALWPHCRVFQLNHPEPVLRGLMEPARVGAILSQAVASAAAPDKWSERPAASSLTATSASDRDPLPQPAGA